MAPVAQQAPPAPSPAPIPDDWADTTLPTRVAAGRADDSDWADDPLDDPNSIASHAALNLRNNRLAGMLPPPPPQPLPAMDAFFSGVGRGAVSTGTQIGKFLRGAATGDFGAYSDPAVEEQLHGSNPTSIDPQGGADSVGYYGEKLAELLTPAGLSGRAARAAAAGADVVLPSGRVLAEIPAVTGRLGRAAIAGGMEGLSNATVTGLQTGDPHAAAWAGALGALTAVPLKYWSKTERVKALIGGIVDPALAKPAAEAGTFVQGALADAREAAGRTLGNEYASVTAQAAAHGNPTIALDAPGVAEAQRLLAQLEGGVKNVPGLGAVDDVNKARGILQDMIEEAQSGKGVSVAEAIQRRTFLRDIANSPVFQTTTGKGALQRLTGAWHDSVTSALDAASPGLGQQFSRASAQYRQFITTFNSQTIRALIRKGAPERVLDVLMSGSGETTATNLRQMIGAQNMEVVRSSLWERLLQKSSPGDSTFLAPKFDAMLDKLSPEAQAAVFGSEQTVVRMRKFASMMDTSWVHEGAKQSVGKIAMKAGTGALAGIGADRVLEHDGAGGWKVWGPSGAAMALAPALVAKVLAKPGSIDVLEKAMTTSPVSSAGKVVANKLASLVMGVEMQSGDREGAPTVGSPDAKGVLATLAQSDAARRERARSTSAMVSGPPAPAGTPGESSVHPRRPGDQIEFPVSGRDENDAMFMKRADDSGKVLKFPVPVLPSTLLPPHFKNARNVRYGAPLSGDIKVKSEEAQGAYGRPFDAGSGSNTVLVAGDMADEPGVYAHEVNHAAWLHDLAPEEKQRFQSKMTAALDSVIAAKRSGGAAAAHAFDGIPKAVYLYGWAYRNSPANAFNEAFAELGAQYMLNPTAFRAKYPDWYGMFKEFYGGKEYVSNSGAQMRGGRELKQNNP